MQNSHSAAIKEVLPFFSNLGNLSFFFFSIICIGVQLIYRVVLFMILDACIPILAYS